MSDYRIFVLTNGTNLHELVDGSGTYRCFSCSLRYSEFCRDYCKSRGSEAVCTHSKKIPNGMFKKVEND